MVKQSLDALVNADANLARQVRDEDDEVDDRGSGSASERIGGRSAAIPSRPSIC